MKESKIEKPEKEEGKMEEKLSFIDNQEVIDAFKEYIPVDIQPEILARAMSLYERNDEFSESAAFRMVYDMAGFADSLKERADLRELLKGIVKMIDKMIEQGASTETIAAVLAEIFGHPSEEAEIDIETFSDEKVIENLKRLEGSQELYLLASYIKSGNRHKRTEDIDTLNSMEVDELKKLLKKKFKM